MRLDYQNLTNQAVAKCSVFGPDMARIEIVSDKIVHNDNVVNLEWSLLGGKGEFGVGDVRVKSIKKANKPPPPPPKKEEENTAKADEEKDKQEAKEEKDNHSP